jgi:hypothetical protein
MEATVAEHQIAVRVDRQLATGAAIGNRRCRLAWGRNRAAASTRWARYSSAASSVPDPARPCRRRQRPAPPPGLAST